MRQDAISIANVRVSSNLNDVRNKAIAGSSFLLIGSCAIGMNAMAATLKVDPEEINKYYSTAEKNRELYVPTHLIVP
jgi:hypothetical protein